MNSIQDKAGSLLRRRHRLPSADELVRFRQAAQRSRAVLTQVARELFPGITERTAAKILEERLLAAGAERHLIEPRVLFGERATLPRPGHREDTRPGWSTLESTEVYLLEAIPLLGGLPAPAACSGGLAGRPEGFSAGQQLLSDVRTEIPACIAAGGTCRDVARMVRELGKRRGWRDSTQPRAGWALARRMQRLPGALSSSLAPWGGAGLERARLGFFGLRRKAPASRAQSVLWSDDPAADRPVAQGLWMVAPRFARGPLAVLSREFLWVDEDGPRWLDDGPIPRD